MQFMCEINTHSGSKTHEKISQLIYSAFFLPMNLTLIPIKGSINLTALELCFGRFSMELFLTMMI